MQLTRRRLLSAAGMLGATGLLAACSSAVTPSPTTGAAAAPTQAATQPPAIAPVATATPAVGVATVPVATTAPAAPAAQPTAAPSPTPSGVAFKQMYQQDAQHTGRSPFAGPTRGTVKRRFDTSTPDNMPADALTSRDDFQSTGVIGPDGTIYIANFPGVLFALRDSPAAPDRLDLVWKFHPPAASSLHATPALSSDGGTVYLGFTSGGFNGPGQATLYAVKAASTGPEPQVAWSADLGATRVMASPTVGPDGTID